MPASPALATVLARWVVGLIFAMAGYWKTFTLGPLAHAERFFVSGYADHWMPTWLLWATGATVPVVELAAGIMLCIGLRIRDACAALAAVLVLVTYGHLLADPLFDTTSHIFPRTCLVLFILVMHRRHDAWNVDAWLQRRTRTA